MRTGIAFAEIPSGFIVALETIEHQTFDELASRIVQMVNEKKIDRLVIGSPRLLSGKEGSQVSVVQSATDCIQKRVNLPIEFLDERYTTIVGKMAKVSDADARAACELLIVWLDRRKAIDN